MKKLLLLFTFFATLTMYAQELKFEEIVKVDSLRTKKELFSTAKLWLSETYNSGKDVIQMEDQENGIILGKAVQKYNPDFFMSSIPARGYINYTIKLSFKDGRYKIEFYDFIHEGSTNEYGQNGTIGLINDGEKYTGNSGKFSKSYRNKVNEDAQSQIKKKIPNIIESLKEYMSSSKNIPTNNNDW